MATLGYTSAGGSAHSNLEHDIVGSYFTAIEYGRALSISAYVNIPMNVQFKFGIFEYEGIGDCGNIVAETAIKISSVNGNRWETLDLPSNPILRKDTNYFFVFWSNAYAGSAVYYTTESNKGVQKLNESFTTYFPSPLIDESSNSRKYSIYTTYETDFLLLYSSSTYIVINMPESITIGDERGQKTFHFWNDVDLTSDVGKESENITLTGFHPSSVSYTFSALDNIVNDGEIVTISGFNNTDIDTTWIISSYSYTVTGGQPDKAEWSISLEKT